jgi:phage terminase small subunit
MAEGLTNKQRLFVEAYLQCLNATEAAKWAGYSEKTAYSIGWENLKKPEIDAAIRQGLADRAMPADEAAMRLSEQARGSIRGFIATDEDGRPNGFSLTDDRPLHLVKKVSVTDKGWSFEMHDAQSALVNVLKLHGKFVDRVAIESELQAALDRLRAQLSPVDYAKVAAILIAGDVGA